MSSQNTEQQHATAVSQGVDSMWQLTTPSIIARATVTSSSASTSMTPITSQQCSAAAVAQVTAAHARTVAMTSSSSSRSSQTLPLAVARGTVASVCVTNRMRAASQPRSGHESSANDAHDQRTRSSPSRSRTNRDAESRSPSRSAEGQTVAPTTQSGHYNRRRSRRGANRSRDVGDTSMAPAGACSVRVHTQARSSQPAVNPSDAAADGAEAAVSAGNAASLAPLDVSQLSVDVLQTSQQQHQQLQLLQQRSQQRDVIGSEHQPATQPAIVMHNAEESRDNAHAPRRPRSAVGGGDAPLPDILNSHLLPSYATALRQQPNDVQLSPSSHGSVGDDNDGQYSPVRPSSGGGVGAITGDGDWLSGYSPHQHYDIAAARRDVRRAQRRQQRNNNNVTRASRASATTSSATSSSSARRRSLTQLDGSDKGCCDGSCCRRCLTVATTFRWVLVFLAVLGVICVGVGIILGSLHMTNSHKLLTLALMFIGLGVMLVVVVGVGWKCTPTGHEPCHLLFNLGAHSHSTSQAAGRTGRRRRERSEWHGGMMYSEFRHRRPPPSYNASQDHHQRIVTTSAQSSDNRTLSNNRGSTEPGGAGEVSDNFSLPSSPPPTYRSHASTTRTGVHHIVFPPMTDDYPNSRPPTYRSHAGELEQRRPRLDSITNDDTPRSQGYYEQIHIPVSAATPTATAESSASGGGGINQSTLHQIVHDAVQYLDNVLNDAVVDVDNVQLTHAPCSSATVESGTTTSVVLATSSVSDNQSLSTLSNANNVISSAVATNGAAAEPPDGRRHRVNSDTYRVEVSHFQGQPRIDVISRGNRASQNAAATPVVIVDAGTQTGNGFDDRDDDNDVTDTQL